MDVFSIGETVIDFIPGAEEASYIRKAGGAPTNVAVAVSRNGLEAGMCSSVGDDDFGRFLTDTLRENGVEVLREEPCANAITTMAFVTLSPDGDRSFTFARKPGADMFLEERDVREEDIGRSAIVHAGSCSLSADPAAKATVRALRLGHEMGALVSFDVNYRDLMWDGDETACARAVEEILPYVDLLKISDQEVDMLGGEEALPSLMEKNAVSVVVETLGADGARCFFAGEQFDAPAYKGECVDATGAGDAFWGGFLSSLRLQGVSKVSDIARDKLEKALSYGNAAGGVCVRTKGAIESLPKREQIEAVIKEGGCA